MNPRYRRLLIPGLLIALLVVVLVSALAHRADGETGGPAVVSHLTDLRITESSGLAVSGAHDDLAYTINDSGNPPIVYAVKVSTGAVVGTTTITGGQLVDTEAIGIDAKGTLWVADTGDNRESRKDVALYALPEPGPGEHTVAAPRFPITYDGGPLDVEALLVDPRTGAPTLVSKEILGGRVFSLPASLTAAHVNRAKATGKTVSGLVTDGALTADGRYALLRTYAKVYVYDRRTWDLVRDDDLPPQPQGESIAIERSGRTFLIGTEGTASALIRIPLVLRGIPSATTTPGESSPGRSSSPPADSSPPIAPLAYLVGAVVVTVVVGAGVALVSRRSR